MPRPQREPASSARIAVFGPFCAGRIGRNAGWSLALWFGLAAGGWAQDGGARSPEPGRDFNRPIVVGAVEASFPYSYLDDSGRVQGFAVEVIDALGRVMGLELSRRLETNVDMAERLGAGEIDVVQLWAETPARQEIADFSVPLLRLETVVVKRRGDSRLRQLEDLRGRIVGVGTPGTVAERFIQEQFPTARVRHTATAEEFLRAVERGTFDAGVLSRLTALSMIDHYGLTQLEVLDAHVRGYDVRYGFAVRQGDAQLLARLNEGLAILHRSGEFAAIYDRWFGRYERPSFTREEVTTAAALTLALGLIAALGGWLWQRRLAARITHQADELLEQRHLLGALFDSHPLATFVLERTGEAAAVRVLSLNREAGTLCGLDPAQVAGRPLAALALAPELRGYLDELVRRWPSGGITQQHELHLRESQRLLETSLVPLGDHAGAERLCVLARDVTRRRLEEREIAQARRVRALGELVGGLAHEFNNLLTPVIMKAGFMRDDHRGDPVLSADLQVIEESARRAADLTRRLLTFGRRSEDAPRLVRLDEVLENCFALLRPTVDRRIVWDTAVPPGLPPVTCHATDVHQIVFNLVLNARDALLEVLAHPPAPDWRPQLGVSVTSLPASTHAPRAPQPGAVLAGWQRLTVTDNGVGIPPAALDRMFEPFFTTKDVGRGTGLGLATVWHLAAEAGGFVEVESTVGQGSRFHVFLPAWSRPSGAAAALSSAPASAPVGVPSPASLPLPPVVSTPAPTMTAVSVLLPPSGPASSLLPSGLADPPGGGDPAVTVTRGAPAARSDAGRRVLLVEDEELVARTTRLLLERTGHSVVHVSDGASALRQLGAPAADFDVLLADINMPGMGGVELVSRVRATAFAGRIVVMSGRVAEEDLRALDQLHVDHVLPKPFMLQQLLEALQCAPLAAATPGHARPAPAIA